MSRAKGTRLERAIAGPLLLVDGPDPIYEKLASSTGRIGHLDLGADIVTRRFAIEAKNRESLSARLWEWLDHISVPDHLPLLVLKRNHKRPLVVLSLDDFINLLEAQSGTRSDS